MIRILQILIVFIASFSCAVAQDVVVFRTGEEKESIVKKVGITSIEYVRFDNPDGAIYEVLKDDVFMIQFENGVKEYFELSIKEPTNDSQVNEGLFIDIRDSINYKYIKIGNQIWMAENLRYDDGKSPCSPDDSEKCDKCGRYYRYEEAIIACPDGWHLPTDGEWMNLEIEVGMFGIEANEYGWRGTPPGQAPTLLMHGKTGVNLNLCGYLTQGNLSKKNPWFNDNRLYEDAFYWTSTDGINNNSVNNNAIIRHLRGRASIERTSYTKKWRFSVRCIKDND